MGRKPYPSDVSDEEWAILKEYVPEVQAGGRPAKHSRREIVNGILYVLRTGCGWDYVPHDLPAGKTLYDYFRQWRRQGIWEAANTALRERTRLAAGREANPSAAIIDSQSAKTTEKGGLVALITISR
jgi:transposase